MTADANSEKQKREAARRALDLVEPGMRLGLGTGSTARHFVELVGQKVADGLDVRCVATSEATQAQAKRLGIPTATLDELPELDLTVDGADEIDHQLRLIKGGGGALAARKDRRCGLAADGGDRRRDETGFLSRRLSTARRSRSFWPRGDPPTYRTRHRRPRPCGPDPLRGEGQAVRDRRGTLHS